jgi:ABC-type multidrug transport system fused ATPase/permease subunit
MFILAQAASISSNLWLANWSNQGAEAAKNVVFYLYIYAALSLSAPMFVIVRSFLVALCGLGAAKKFHEQMLHSAMRAPVSFFDTTPIGRILNRFTKDIADVDQMVPPVLMQFTDLAFSVLGVLVVISLATPWFLVPLVPLAYFYKYIQRYYVRTSRELKRLDSISKSPIFAHFSETLAGLSIIRAYKRIAVFVLENEHKLNENAKAYFSLFASNRWSSFIQQPFIYLFKARHTVGIYWVFGCDSCCLLCGI